MHGTGVFRFKAGSPGTNNKADVKDGSMERIVVIILSLSRS